MSGEHKMSPEKETLTQYLEEISPGKHAVSQDSQDNVSTESIKSGDNGDISHTPIEPEDKAIDIKENPSLETDHLIGFKKPFYYCKQHPDVQNIHREEIEHHIKYSKEHGGK